MNHYSWLVALWLLLSTPFAIVEAQNPNVWTWVGGSDVDATYGTLGNYDPSNWPGARYGHVAVYVPEIESILMFGGFATVDGMSYSK